MKDVVIVISSYNGEAFLQEQLESLVKQVGVRPKIFIRDDGSSDSTLDIVKQFASNHPEIYINWVSGKNLGCSRSFMSALSQAPRGDYYCFCDQDDVWLEDKLIRSIQHLDKHSKKMPSLYYSNVTYVDQDLNHLSHSEIIPSQTLIDALFENKVHGCTAVFDEAAREEILKSWNLSDETFPGVIHDWWSNLVISAVGSVVFDSESRILYRQHQNNEIGGSKSNWSVFVGKVKFFIRNGIQAFNLCQQARGLIKYYRAEMAPKDIQYVEALASSKEYSLLKKLKFVLKNPIPRDKRIDRIVVTILFALNLH